MRVAPLPGGRSNRTSMHSKVHARKPTVEHLDSEILWPAKVLQQSEEARHQIPEIELIALPSDRPDLILAIKLDHDSIKLREPS